MLKSVKNFFTNKRNIKIVIGLLIAIVIIVAVVFLVVKGSNKTNEEELKTTFREMAVDFYENYYYVELTKKDEKIEEILSRFTQTGIKINLDNLSRYNSKVNKEKLETFVNSETGEKCNIEESTAIIYPKESYGKEDYEIKIQLVCGFEEEKE